MRAAFGTFEGVIVRDLLPMIDASYRTIPDREHRAMAGLSMGGMQTLFIGLQHLELFAYIGSFSGPIIQDLKASDLTVIRNSREPFDAKAHMAAYLRIRGIQRAREIVLARRGKSGVGSVQGRHRRRRRGAARNGRAFGILRVEWHGTRVADVAAGSQRFRAAAFPLTLLPRRLKAAR